MKSRTPTALEIEELVSFLPRFCGERTTPIVKWRGGVAEGPVETSPEHGNVYVMPWPEYAEDVTEFLAVAEKECWMDYDYQKNLDLMGDLDPGTIGQANIKEIKSILTWCIRGERFVSGHLAGVIESGLICSVLRRLAELGSIEDH